MHCIFEGGHCKLSASRDLFVPAIFVSIVLAETDLAIVFSMMTMNTLPWKEASRVKSPMLVCFKYSRVFQDVPAVDLNAPPERPSSQSSEHKVQSLYLLTSCYVNMRAIPIE